MTRPLSEDEFRSRADEALQQARQALVPVSATDDLEIRFEDGVLSVRSAGPRGEATFTAAPRLAERLIRVSAPGETYDLVWSEIKGTFTRDDEPLPSLLQRLTTRHLRDL